MVHEPLAYLSTREPVEPGSLGVEVALAFLCRWAEGDAEEEEEDVPTTDVGRISSIKWTSACALRANISHLPE